MNGGYYMTDENKRIAIVTGGNSGIGKATVEALADKGFTVVMVCRSKERGGQALKELQNSNRDIHLMLCDLANMEDIRRFTDEFKEKFNRLDVLINNAGLISLKRNVTVDGLEEQFGVNHIGHFLLTLRLLDCMQSGSHIIIVSSCAHKVGKIHFEDYNLEEGYSAIKAYSQSKLANVLFARELSARVKDRGIRVNCFHPGIVGTSFFVGRNTAFGKVIVKVMNRIFSTPEEGAQTAIYLATSPEVENKTGAYFYRCKVAKTSRLAKLKSVGVRLFELSEKITGETLEYTEEE